ncbi:MAG: aminoacyl-tRNA hydrolase [Chloroflexi bacterium]|nr:aminoacyl-tRNA hydrolase [Chloroflexota bacterium]
MRINRHLAIPLEEITFRFSRASGPGGQHVNRTATRVEMFFDVASSPSLSEAERALLLRHLAPYLDSRGVLRLVSQESPSQWRNRQEVLARFQALLARGLRQRKPRLATRPTAASRERRLRAKRARSLLKAERRRVLREEG